MHACFRHVAPMDSSRCGDAAAKASAAGDPDDQVGKCTSTGLRRASPQSGLPGVSVDLRGLGSAWAVFT